MNKIIFSCLIIFLKYFISNVTSLESENIVGNLLAEPDQFKHVVAIHSHGLHICGGSLIADNMVLTAAHCFHEYEIFDDYNYEVTAGIINIYNKNSDNTRDVEKVFVLEDYIPGHNNTSHHDIAVVHLKSSFNMKNLATLKLPEENEIYDGGVIAGFGYNVFKDKVNENSYFVFGTSDGRLRYGHMKFDEDYFNKHTRFKRKNLIAAISSDRLGKFTGVCLGDSGGVIVANNTALAIAILVFSCDQKSIPALCTDVKQYLNFIKAAMDDNPSPNTIVYKPNSRFFTRIKNSVKTFFTAKT